ncbi:MAG: hypothetical protein AB8H86_31555 [Polyangiales bacterium]
MDPRHKIRCIVPPPPSQGGDLSKVATDALIECAHDSKERWWVRAAVIRELGRRLEESELAPLEKVLRNRAENPSVRIPALKSMCAVVSEGDLQARTLVAWLQAQSGIDGGYGFAEQVLAARAGLGDVSVSLELAVLASDAWTHRRACALDALRMLAERVGEVAILAELGCASYLAMATDAPRFEVRLHGVRELHDAGEDITPFLADPSRIVARYVFDALTDSDVNVTVARQLAETAQSQEARAWAALTLFRAGMPLKEAMAFLEEPFVSLPGVPDEIRHAILREYAPGQRETNPRWLLERATLPTGPSEDELEERADARLKRLMEALQALGLKPETPISAGDAFQQGSGTYFKITIPGSSMLQLSTLGPFIIDEEETPADIRAAAEACGLTWVEEYAPLPFSGLCVYHFGKREPLRVGELLFYWQD